MKTESNIKLKKLNQFVDERLQRGTDVLHLKPIDPEEHMEEKHEQSKSKQRLLEISERVKKAYASNKIDEDNQSIIKITNKAKSLQRSSA